MTTQEDKLALRLLSLSGIKFDQNISYFEAKIENGLIVINQNYSSVIEKIKACIIKIFNSEKKLIASFEVSDGWMQVNKNKCDIFVCSCNKA